ncbi:ribonuclease H [Cephaloticoccus primus]|uniref:Ribonuclease n=1 Tax=Cephaloticoccus primus TaxID=1548207 RepID=A0A139SS01_9BACT|nr:ribonuclease HII [Cephaloticoccus primus]KXU37338.1 ribonuclease H [Cephaloticoccus primus]
MARRRQLRSFDLKKIAGYAGLIGVDEAGRGALAGPVVAAAVLVTRDFLEGRWALANAGRVNDSKQLSALEREALCFDFEVLAGQAQLRLHWGLADVDEIAQLNILGATKLAMRRALEGLYPPSAFAPERPPEPDLFSGPEALSAYQPPANAQILIDGLALRHFPYPHVGIVKGDARSLCIAMASVVAKVKRDRLMRELAREFPAYGFEQHKGYGTEQHREALLAHGRSPQHREVFLRKLFARRVDPGQGDFLASVSSD